MTRHHFSPAMETALSLVLADMATGRPAVEVTKEVAKLTGFMEHEIRVALAIRQADDRLSGKPHRTNLA